MGSLFDSKGLTKTGVQNPGNKNPQDAQYYDSPAAAGMELARRARATAAPSTSTIDGTLGAPGAPTIATVQQDAPGDIGPVRPDITTITPGAPAKDNLTYGMTDAPVAPQPVLTHPTWADAQASNNPGAMLTTKGKLLTLLIDAGLGAAAGASASENGGPRSGYPGLGTAAIAGVMAPLQIRGTMRQLQAQQIAQAQEAALRQAEVDAIPGRQALTAAQFADIQSQTAERNARAKSYLTLAGKRERDPQLSLQDQYAARVQQVLQDGGDPSSDPQVQHLSDAITSLERQPAETAYRDWRKMNPDADPNDFYRGHQRVPAGNDGPRLGTPGQFARVESAKATALARAEQAYTAAIKRGDDPQVAFDTLNKAKADAQSGYEAGIRALGGSVSASPETHVFNPARWAAAHPKGDVNAAIAAAKAAGYQVTQ